MFCVAPAQFSIFISFSHSTSFFELLLVVLTEVATDGLYKSGQLAIVTPTLGHQVVHLAKKFLPNEVGVLELRAADMDAKNREKHRNKGHVHIF